MTYASLGELSSLDQDSHEITADLTRLLRRWALEPDTEQDVREKVLRAVDEMAKLDPETVDMKTGDPFEKFNDGTFLELLTNFLPPYSYVLSEDRSLSIRPDLEALAEAVRDGDVLDVPAGDEWPDIPADVHVVREVNDHGNVSIFDAHTGKMIWDCV